MTDNNSEHVTSDIGEAAYLKLLGFKITGFDRSNPNRVAFIFQGDAELLRMKAMDYEEFRTKVDARAFADALKSLKKSVNAGKPRV